MMQTISFKMACWAAGSVAPKWRSEWCFSWQCRHWMVDWQFSIQWFSPRHRKQTLARLMRPRLLQLGNSRNFVHVNSVWASLHTTRAVFVVLALAKGSLRRPDFLLLRIARSWFEFRIAHWTCQEVNPSLCQKLCEVGIQRNLPIWWPASDPIFLGFRIEFPLQTLWVRDPIEFGNRLFLWRPGEHWKRQSVRRCRPPLVCQKAYSRTDCLCKTGVIARRYLPRIVIVPRK